MPTPGSPDTTTSWHSPATAAFKRFWSSASSLVRPTSGAWATRGACIDCVVPATARSRSLSRSRERYRFSASATSPARCGRRPGSFCRHERMIASSSSSISAPASRGDWGNSCTTR